MNLRIKMTKRLMVVICIIVATLSFMGGMVYKYEDYKPIVSLSTIDATKYYYEFSMPLDKKTANTWLDWAMDYHELYTNKASQEYHRDSIRLYGDIKTLFAEFYAKWEP